MPSFFSFRLAAGVAAVLSFVLAGPASAQVQPSEAAVQEQSQGFSIELNRAVPTDGGCRLGFITRNNLGADLSKAAFEIVLFNPEGLIERLLVLDFGAMPEGRTKVREFNLSGSSCDRIARVLVNDVSACEGENVAEDACASALTASSRSEITFGL